MSATCRNFCGLRQDVSGVRCLTFNVFPFFVDNLDHIFRKFGNPLRCRLIGVILYCVIIDTIYVIPKVVNVGIIVGGGRFGTTTQVTV